MSTKELAVKQDTQLAVQDEQTIQAILDQELNEVMNLGGFDFRPGKIKIMHREKQFVTSDGQAVKTISGVIVYFHKARGFWEKEGEKIPRCSSMDGKAGQWKTGALEEVETVAKICANCPYNEYGSDNKGGKGKACKEMRRLFLVETGSILPVMFSIPPTSLKPYDEYISALVSKRKAPIAYETVFRLEGAQGGGGFDYSKVTLELGQALPSAKISELLRMRDQVVAAAAKIGIESDDYMGDETTPAGGSAGENLRDDKDVY